MNICRERAQGGVEGCSTHDYLEEVEILQCTCRRTRLCGDDGGEGNEDRLAPSTLSRKRHADLRTVSDSVVLYSFLVTDCDLPLSVAETDSFPVFGTQTDRTEKTGKGILCN